MASFADGADATIEAVVQIGSAETPYRRGGRGAAVLLLASGSATERTRVFQRLTASHLVIEPLALPAPEDWPVWLRGVVDGLGLVRPDLVVSPDLAPAADAFAAGDPERAGRVIPVEAIDARVSESPDFSA